MLTKRYPKRAMIPPDKSVPSRAQPLGQSPAPAGQRTGLPPSANVPLKTCWQEIPLRLVEPT
jgi:hypothetical protein